MVIPVRNSLLGFKIRGLIIVTKFLRFLHIRLHSATHNICVHGSLNKVAYVLKQLYIFTTPSPGESPGESTFL